MRPEIAALQEAMEMEGYIADPAIATALYLSREMRRPLLIEGDAGVGKTEIAKVLSRLMATELIRLQCYEGLDASTSLYEWNYQRQMLRLRLAEGEGKSPNEIEDLIFGRAYLLERPASSSNPPVRDPAKAGRKRPQSQGAPGRQEREPDIETAVAAGEEPGFSPEAVLRRKSFEDYSPADLTAMEMLLGRLALRLATRPSRRRVPVRGGGERSFRRAISQGGEFISLARRDRPIERTRLVVLCDTSGSMDPYTRFLLTFVLALRGVAPRSEVFAFNTALARLTGALRRPGQGRIDHVLERLAARVPDWSGGTKIGEFLAELVDHYLHELVDGKTIVIILSDGLDRGDVQPLAGAMRAIRSRARRVIWLNPLAGDERYEPTARAMAAAFPFVDRLLPAHNLESLERLIPLLAA